MIFLAWQTTPEMTEQPHLLLAWVGKCIKEFEMPAPLLGQLEKLDFEKLSQKTTIRSPVNVRKLYNICFSFCVRTICVLTETVQKNKYLSFYFGVVDVMLCFRTTCTDFYKSEKAKKSKNICLRQ